MKKLIEMICVGLGIPWIHWTVAIIAGAIAFTLGVCL